MRKIDALLVRYRAMSAGELKDLLKNAVLEKEIEQACLGVLEEKIGGAQVDAFKAELRVQEKGHLDTVGAKPPFCRFGSASIWSCRPLP